MRLGVESGVDDVCADIVREAIPDRPQCFYPGVALHIIKLAHHTTLIDNLLTIFEIDGGGTLSLSLSTVFLLLLGLMYRLNELLAGHSAQQSFVAFHAD